MTTQRIAELEAEVMRLREALEHLSKAAGQTIDVRTPEDWVNLNIGLSLSIQALSAPFIPTALPELIENVENEWQPISTAPKDEAVFLAWRKPRYTSANG